MTSRPGGIEISRSYGDPAGLALTGKLETGTVLMLAGAVSSMLSAWPPPQVLILDLTKLSFLAAAGVRFLHTATNHAIIEGTAIRIVTADNPAVTIPLRVAGLHRVLDTYPDCATALAAGAPAEFLDCAATMWNT
ncbi:STAS domain-containing protein [Amycolatopsis azurea]|uniref:STAS domain-containing protein n=1 Tax=Amycolatopsis azurea TaxID=36819 RepID=UPI0037F8A816